LYSLNIDPKQVSLTFDPRRALALKYYILQPASVASQLS